MKQKMHLSNREYDVMKVFWMEGKELSKADFLWGEEATKCSPILIQRVLDGLSKKGFLKFVGKDELIGKVYQAAVSYAEWIKSALCEILNEISEEEAMCCMLDAFAEKDGKISGDMVRAMKEYLEAIEAMEG